MPCLAGLAGQNLAEQGFAADRLQRPLRARFQRRLTPSVSVSNFTAETSKG